MEHMSTALLDADILLYIASRGAEDKIDWEDGSDPVITANFDKGVSIVTDVITRWHRMSGMDDYAIVFSDRINPCFRNAIYPIYKLHRVGYERPELYDILSDWIKDNTTADWYLWDTLEADDTLGIIQMEMNREGHPTCIVSIDKDMLTIPGKHLNPNKTDDPGPMPPGPKQQNNATLTDVSPAEADYNWMMQTVAGDRVDNYKGAPGIGAKGAAKLLDPHFGDLDGMWNAALDGFADQWDKPNWSAKFQFEDPFDEALANARCARILRDGDFNRATGEVKLWTP